MRQADRLSAILEELSRNGSVSVADLASGLDASLATIRRDLQLLEEQHLVSRVHGGAVARGVLYELPLRYKAARHQDEKRGIAADRNARTSVDRVYVVGRSARPGRSQAIISAGDGAAAAIDILSRERGEDVLDWDEPPKT